MAERVNRRDQIVGAAAELFVNNGYSATSVRQISDAVGVTEAAIYYHFKDKRALLQEVVECHLPDFLSVLDEVKDAETLHDLLIGYGNGIARLIDNQERIQRMRWVLAEFPNLSQEEQDLFRMKYLRLHSELSAAIGRFIPDEQEAGCVGWTLICAGFGYGQLFQSLGLKQQADFTSEQLIQTLTQMLE